MPINPATLQAAGKIFSKGGANTTQVAERILPEFASKAARGTSEKLLDGKILGTSLGLV